MSGRYTGRHVHHKTMPGGHDATLISITNWLNDVFYQTGALVAYGGTVYISLQDDNYAKTPDSEAAWWATLFILDAADSVKDTHIDWGTGAGQVSAVDVPIADAGGRITGTEVETGLQELAGAGRTTESIKGNADDLDTHEAVQTAGVHGSTSAATASKLMHRDASGRSQVAAPSAAADIARKDTVDNHANTQTAGIHGSAVAATANKLIHRDASGRAQVATPSAAADIATKGYVDGATPPPIGAIYIQFYGSGGSKTAPGTLWSGTTWTDKSSEFAGRFFRAVGGAAAAFGTPQGFAMENINASWETRYVGNSSWASVTSGAATAGAGTQTGESTGTAGTNTKYTFNASLVVTTASETRPTNYAIQIWERTA